jgi:hypothetical protein
MPGAGGSAQVEFEPAAIRGAYCFERRTLPDYVRGHAR